MGHAATELRHHHARLVRFHPVHEDRALRRTRRDGDTMAARAAACRHRPLVDALRCQPRLIVLEVQPRVRGKAGAAVAVAAVHIHKGPRPRGERLGRIVPARQPCRCLGQPGQPTGPRPGGKLVFTMAIQPAVEVLHRRADRRGGGALLMALLALVGVRHGIIEAARPPLRIDEADRDMRSGALQHGLGLRGVPHIGERHPAGLAPHQQPRLDDPQLLVRRAKIGRIAKALYQHGADGKVRHPGAGGPCRRTGR